MFNCINLPVSLSSAIHFFQCYSANSRISINRQFEIKKHFPFFFTGAYQLSISHWFQKLFLKHLNSKYFASA